MRRIVTKVACLGALSMAVLLTGCGDSGDEGVPKDLTPTVPLNSIKADMSTSKREAPKTSPAAEQKK